jgi:LPS sulfotransferase NodH
MNGNFLVLGTGRSGTSWLIDTINGHPDLCAYGEMFNLGIKAPKKLEEFYIQSAERRRYVRPISTWKFLTRHFGNTSRTGFKLLYGDARHFPEVVAYLAARRFRVIHLIRQNQLDVMISRENVYQNLKKWYVREGDNLKIDTLRVFLPVDDLAGALAKKYRTIEQARRFLRLARLPHIELDYETLKANRSEFERVWDFLGVASPPEGPVSSLRKIRTQSHREILQNYAEVQSALAGTAYEHLLEP